MEKKSIKVVVSIILNIIVVISCAVGIYIQALRDGLGIFKWYTDLSNIFAGITALLCIVFSFLFLFKNKEFPFFVKLLNFFSTSGLALTFMVVAFVLAPSRGPGGHKQMMFSSFGLFLHTISPILAILNFLFLEDKPVLKFKATFIVILPTLFYAIIIILLNVFYLLDGPYFFFKVHNQSVIMSILWVLILSAADYLFNFLLWFGNKKLSK